MTAQTAKQRLKAIVWDDRAKEAYALDLTPAAILLWCGGDRIGVVRRWFSKVGGGWSTISWLAH